ncbi:hypothetical protein ACG7TL_002200 [Trametes sanguinea]
MLNLWVAPLMWAIASVNAQQVEDVDDTNPGMFYTGSWVPDGDPHTFGSHDTWTNQSGASVTFNFIGTQIKVFVTRRPVGTYLSNASFSIDGGPSEFWTTEDPVPAISYKNLVYTSKSLSPAQHKITVTNFGAVFWLDYMEYTVASGGNLPTSTTSPTNPSPSPTNSEPQSTNSSPQVTPTQTNPTQSQTGSSNTASGNGSQTSRSIPAAPTSGSGGKSATSGAATSSTSHGDGYDGMSASGGGVSWSFSKGWSSPTGMASPGNASSSTSSSRTGMVVGIVVGVLGGIALLLASLWWLRMRSQARQRALNSLAATPFAGQSPYPSAYFTKDHPPMTPEQLATLHPYHLQNPDPAANQWILAQATGHGEIILEAIPAEHAEMLTGRGPASIPSVPETAQPSAHSHSTRNMPPSRSAWLARALSLSSARYRDPGLGSTTGATSTLSDTTAYASSPVSAPSATSGSSSHRPLYFRVLRRSRDGGVRIAGGRPGARGSQMYTPAEYDDVLEVLSESSTMPPSYAQYSHSAVSDPGQGLRDLVKLTAWLICLAFLAPSVLAAPPLEAGSSPRPPVQCQSFVFTWRGGTPPFTVLVLSGDSTESPLEQHGGISSGSFQWLADVPAGASVRLEVQDGSGASVDTGPLTIQAGSDSSCLPPSGQAQPQSSSPPDAPTSSPSAIPPTSAETSVDNLATSLSSQSLTGGASPSLPQQSPTSTAAAQGTTTPATGPGTATTANPSQTTPPTTASGPSKGSAPADASNSSVAPIGSPSQLSGSEAPSASRLLSSSTLEGTRADPTASGTLLPQPTLQASPAPPLSIGVIIGAVVGIVIILIILILVILSWRRRRPIKAGK